MRRLPYVAVVFSALSLVAADGQNQPSDASAIQGVWTVVSAEQQGKPATAPVGDSVTFSQDAMKIVEKASGQTHEARIKLDGSKQPKQIDATITKGGQSVTVQGVYAVDKESLRICLARPGKPRPNEFGTKADDGRIMMVLKRAEG
jgi:uncharacterized protein (TIGR03067 family)